MWRRGKGDAGVVEPPECPRANRPGTLPETGGTEVAPGLFTMQGGAAEWSAHAARFGETGLWPVMLESERSLVAGELFPEDDWEATASRDALDVLTAMWDAGAGFDDRRGPFPGPAEPSRGERVPAAADAIRAIRRPWGIGLVAVTRPADVPAAIGWAGPANHVTQLATISAVLRSWEERFDAILVGLGFDTLWLAVRRPPRGEAAMAAAAENYAFCPDLVDQGAGSLERFARDLDGANVWQYWWD